MIIKLALSPLSVLKAIPNPIGSNLFETGLVGANANDLVHLMTTKSNKAGQWLQSAALSDSIIAAKKATEGKMFANRKLGGALMYASSPQKSLALHEFNQFVQAMPAKKMLLKFDGNKLDVAHMKKQLGRAYGADNLMLGAQVTAPVAGFATSYHSAKKDGYSDSEALRKGAKGALGGAMVSAALYAPRKILGAASSMHEHLMKDKAYGYGIIEAASKKAEKSMNRKYFNYSNFTYATPEENAKGAMGHVGNAFKKALGQRKVKGYTKKDGWIYEGENKPSLIQRARKFVDSIPETLGFKMR